MPKLICDVRNCTFNFDRICTKDAIDVDGPSSIKKIETSCMSFISRDIETFNYEFAKFGFEKDKVNEVWCDAIMCVYERGGKCFADKIAIKVVSGLQTRKHNQTMNASDPYETMCQTFEYEE